ncbi:MAG: DinB family protein [Vicinamibacterales bacterium]
MAERDVEKVYNTADVVAELRRLADTLDALLAATAPALRALDEQVAGLKPDPSTWSIKEVLGHLVDSAANNHQRFVRAQEIGELVLPGYEQDHWVRAQAYQARPWAEIVQLWEVYNRHLAHVIRHIPAPALETRCRIADYAPVTLGFIVEDYVTHMRHHLQQIETRKTAR